MLSYHLRHEQNAFFLLLLPLPSKHLTKALHSAVGHFGFGSAVQRVSELPAYTIGLSPFSTHCLLAQPGAASVDADNLRLFWSRGPELWLIRALAQSCRNGGLLHVSGAWVQRLIHNNLHFTDGDAKALLCTFLAFLLFFFHVIKDIISTKAFPFNILFLSPRLLQVSFIKIKWSPAPNKALDYFFSVRFHTTTVSYFLELTEAHSPALGVVRCVRAPNVLRGVGWVEKPRSSPCAEIHPALAPGDKE